MSLILCPECGTKISDKATVCPHCGYISKKKSLPISQQDQYVPVPLFEYDIQEWDPQNDDLAEISIDDNRELFNFFGSWKNIELYLPAIAEVIKAIASKETVMVANYDKYVRELIKKGIYRFSIDKEGEILPTIRDAKGIVQQVRLKEMTFSPQVTMALSNLAMHAQLAMILDEIEYVGDAIRSIHQELQNDRIAMAESAWDKLMQARRIQDSRLRDYYILDVISTATDAKRVLMRNFEENRVYICESSKRSAWEKAKKYNTSGEKDIPTRAEDSFQDLISITNSVRVECEGYAMLGEYEACRESLIEFRSFIKDNKLEKRDTLLMLNGSLKTKQPEVVRQFSDIAQRINRFDTSLRIDYSPMDMLEVN